MKPSEERGTEARDVAALLKMERWSAAEADEMMSAVEKEGLSIAAFASKHGFPCERLYRWQRKRARADADHNKRARPDRAETNARNETARARCRRDAQRTIPALAPVILREQLRLGAAAVIVDPAAGGVRIEVAEDTLVSPSWVAEIVRLLWGELK